MIYDNNPQEHGIPCKPFYSLNEFANLIGKNRDTVKRYIDFDYIRAKKMGGRWIINRSELIKYI
jgi:excisionase family DNA binding protein